MYVQAYHVGAGAWRHVVVVDVYLHVFHDCVRS